MCDSLPFNQYRYVSTGKYKLASYKQWFYPSVCLSLDSMRFNSVPHDILLLNYTLNENYIIYRVFNLVSNSVCYIHIHIHTQIQNTA